MAKYIQQAKYTLLILHIVQRVQYIFAVYCNDIDKRARNMKFTSMLFTASAVYLRTLVQRY